VDVGEHAQDVDTARMDEEVAETQRLIDEAKAAAAELAETNPDPYDTEAEDDEPSGFESSDGGQESPGDEPPGAMREPSDRSD
jgi:hypothetical protein